MILTAIRNEMALRDKLAAIYPADQIDREMDRLIERRAVNARKTAEVVLTILNQMKETQDGPQTAK